MVGLLSGGVQAQRKGETAQGETEQVFFFF